MLSLKPITTNKNVIYFAIFLVLKLNISFITGTMATLIDPNATKNPVDEFGMFEKILVSVIVGPIIETLIFQFGLIELLRRFNVNSTIIICISAVFFGLSHHYSIYYIISAMITGFIYALNY